jgi:uncharacterized protein (DUF1501 family)
MDRPPISRRQFLGQTACAGIGLTGLLSAMGTLRLFNATLSAQTPPDDYKALICLFLYGGNDSNNMLVPRDADGYASYAAARGMLALPRTSLLPLNFPSNDGREYGLHPNMARLQSLFNDRKAAFISNVGTLVAPLTKAEYVSGGAAVPKYLFSHIDQQVQWQTSVPDSLKNVGWGGRLADLKQSLNVGSAISMNISVAGNNFFQTGNEVFQYHVNPDGTMGLHEYDSPYVPRPQQYQAFRDTLAMSYSHLFEAEYADVLKRAVANDSLLRTALASIPSYDDKFANSVDEHGNRTAIAAQLRTILRMIAARSSLGMKRQIFFCSIQGFDTHDNQLHDHNRLLGFLSSAVADFYQATADLEIANNVTLFTASDFNRTYATNGRGSDHAWGSHQFVVGGQVRGGDIYGAMPILQSGGPSDVGARGSWLPSSSTDEYSATLAKWFGVNSAEMPMVLPNIGRFARPDLGFMM